MPKATANGKTFNFPDGTTPEQMGSAIDEYFSSAPQPAQPTPPPSPMTAPQEEGGALSDAWGSFGMGAGNLVSGAGWLFDSETLSNLGETTSAYWEGTLSKAQREANAKRFINDDFSIGEGVTDPRTWGGVIMQSIPAMVPGVGAAGVGARVATAMGAGAKTATTAAGIAGSATEGVTIGAMVGNETYQAVMEAPEEMLSQSPFYQDLIAGGQSPDIAREKVAEKASEAAALPAGVGGAILGVAFNRFVGDAVTGQLTKRLPLEAGKGAAIEGGTEIAQGALESASKQVALNEYAEIPYNPAEALNEVVAGAGAGVGMGATVGGLGAIQGQAEAPEEQGADPAPEEGKPQTRVENDELEQAAFGEQEAANEAAQAAEAQPEEASGLSENQTDDFGNPLADAEQDEDSFQAERADEIQAQLNPESSTPEENKTGIYRVDVNDIQVDPEQYQFRTKVDGEGVDSRLDGIEQWDDARGGSVLLHRREDGSVYVADGHHRVALAKRLGQPSINARFINESDGVTVANAREVAAMNNIADGKADALDIAKVMRNSGKDIEGVRTEFNLPSSQLVRDGEALAKLSDNVFGMVSNGQLADKDGAAIGGNFEQDKQEAAASVFQKVQPQTATQRELLANEIKAAEFAEQQGEQGGLFGDDQAQVSLMQQRLKVLDKLRSTLNTDKRLFKSLNENAGKASKAGNVIAKDKNAAIAETSERSIDLINHVATTPALNELVNAASKRVANGEQVGKVVNDLKQELLNYEQQQERDGITQEGSNTSRSVEPANPVGQDSGRGESVPSNDSARSDGERERSVPEATPQQPLLESYTEAELQQQADETKQTQEAEAKQEAEAEQKEKADKAVGDFQLTGSERTADANPNQGDIFSPPEESAHRKVSAKWAKDNALIRDESEIDEFNELTKEFNVDPIKSNIVALRNRKRVSAGSLEDQAHEAATSPKNDLPEPTEAQKEAGNYKVGKIKVQGLDISVENPQGSTRSGTSPDGKAWSNTMGAHYGYIRKTEGADGDHVDVFVGNKPESDKVWIVDQVNADGSFDEHKVLLGFTNQGLAKQAYKDSYDKGWKVGPITKMSMEEFKTWLKGDTTKPLSGSLSKAQQAKPKLLEKEAGADAEEVFVPEEFREWYDSLTADERDFAIPAPRFQKRSDMWRSSKEKWELAARFGLNKKEVGGGEKLHHTFPEESYERIAFKEDDWKGIPTEIVLASGPNGKWTYGVSVAVHNDSFKVKGQASADIYAKEIFESREQALERAVNVMNDTFDSILSGDVSSRARTFVTRWKGELDEKFGDKISKPKPAKTAADPAPEKKKAKPKAKAKPSSKQEALKDSGVELFANRRGGKALTLEDLNGMSDTEQVKAATKAKVWPKPNYEQLVEDGLNPLAAYAMKTVYDSLATKPNSNSDQSVRAYVETMGKIRDVVQKHVVSDEYKNDIMTALEAVSNASNDYMAQMRAGQTVSDSMGSLTQKVSDEVFPKNENGKRWGATNKEGNTKVLSVGGNRFLQRSSIDSRSLRKAVSDISEGWPAKREAWTKQYSVSEKDGKWILTKKRSRHAIRTHDTQEEAIESARTLAKVVRKAAFKEPSVPLDHVKREGTQYREGDVDADTLRETFGFKGINFGNWMKPADRQLHTNHAYDSFMDLAEILGVPPKAMSLNGSLGIAFGAQGRGGNAAAHFVPGVNEINITKTVGAGSLAHEWGHALDHNYGMIAGLARAKEPFLSEFADKDWKIKDSDIRPEIVEAYKKLLTAMEKIEINRTPEEMEQARKDRQAGAKKDIDRYIERIRSRFMSKADSAQSSRFEELAKKVASGERGEMVSLGKSKDFIGSNANEMRNLARKAHGYMPDKETFLWLDSAVGGLEFAKDAESYAKVHKPQQIKMSEFKRNANVLDKDKKDPYWATRLEMFARSFEMYVLDRLNDSGFKNDYLTSAWKNLSPEESRRVESEAHLRYPQGDERNAINEAFDGLIGALETKETELGIGIQSRSKADAGEGLTVAELQEVVDGFMRDYNGNIPVEPIIVQNQEDIYGEQYSAKNLGYLIEGSYHAKRGKIVLVAGAMRSKAMAEKVLRHEILGHYGLNTFTPDDKQALLTRVLASRNDKAFKQLWKEVDSAYSDKPLLMRAEEVFAFTAEKTDSWLIRLADYIAETLRGLLKKIGFHSKKAITKQDIRDYVRSISSGIRDGSRPQRNFPESDNAQFRAREGDKPFIVPEESIADKLIRKWQDKFKPLKRTQAAIKSFEGRLTEEEDAYMAEEAFHGKTEKDLNDIERDLIQPLVDEMASADIEMSELDLFLIARHAEERNAYIATINDDLPDGGSGMTNAEAEAILKSFKTSGQYAALEGLANKVYAITARRRELLRESGLQSDAQTDAWEEMYEHYVPLKGYADNEIDTKHARVGKGFDIRGKESMRALGRRSMAESPTLHVIQDLTESVIRNRKNEVGQTFLKLVEANPNADYWEIFTEENPDTHTRLVKTSEGESVQDVPLPMHMMRDDYLGVKRDGKEYFIKIHDKRLMEAMKNLGPEPMNKVMQTLGMITRFLSSVNTSYNPEFMISNMVRDVQTAMYNAMAEQDLEDGKVKGKDLAAKMVKGIPKTIRAIWASDRDQVLEGDAAEIQQYYEEFLEDGAKTGYFDSKPLDGIAKDLDRMVKMANGGAVGKLFQFKKGVGGLVERANSAVENGVRLSAYMEARKQGISRKKAASFAKNLTVNFNRKGEVGATLNSLYMFANASIQGTANFARAIGTFAHDEQGGKKLNAAQKAAAVMVGASFVLSALNRFMAGEDDDGANFYDKVPDYVRERNLVLMKSVFGGEPGEYYTIALPYGYNIFYNIGDAMEGATFSEHQPRREGLMWNVISSAINSFSPIGMHGGEPEQAIPLTITPTVLLPFAQIGMNTNHWGSNIYPEDRGFGVKKTDSASSMRSTKDPYKTVAQWLNEVTGGSDYREGRFDIAPDTIEHMMEYSLGGLYSLGARVYEVADATSDGRELDDRNIPFLRKVSGKIMPYGDISRFYDYRREVKAIAEERTSLRGKERWEFQSKYRDILRLEPMLKATDEQMKNLRRRRDRVESREDLTDAERDKRLTEIEERMKLVVDRFNKQRDAVSID